MLFEDISIIFFNRKCLGRSRLSNETLILIQAFPCRQFLKAEVKLAEGMEPILNV